MNNKQQGVLVGAAVIIFAMLIYPPFHIQAQRVVMNKGYSFLWNSNPIETVDTGMLLVQWVAVLLVAGLLWLALRSKK